MKRLVAGLIVATTLGLAIPPAVAGPVEDVWDIYERKFGCDAQDPLLCPGP